MARRGVLGLVAAATLLAGGAALARDLAADAPYPVEAPEAPAAAAHPKHHDAKQAAVPLPRAAPVQTTASAPPPEKPAAALAPAIAVPMPKAAPQRPAEPVAPKLAALPPAKPEPKSEAKPAPVAERSTDIFAGIPAGERLKIQASLLWAGDYTGASGSEDPMLTAIKNFQKRIKARVTGVLTAEERARLVAADDNHAEAFGWTVVTDPATGIRIGLPAKLVTQAHDTAQGTRWSSKHGEVQVETFRLKRADLKLDAVFEEMKRGPGGAGNRKIETSALRDDGFVISGMQGLKFFTVRAKMRDGEVRGVTVSYDQMMETIVAPVTVAMASAFTPFPERNAPFAALAKAVDYGSGVVVSARGHIVTSARLAEGCQVLLASGLGNAERIAEDKTQGLALLRIYGRRSLHPVALSDAPKPGEAKLIGIPDPRAQNGHTALTEVKARLTTGGIELRQPAPMAGLAGAAAIDAQGHFAGIAEMRNIVVASNEPAIAPVRLVGASAIRDFLAANGVTPAAASGDARDAVVRIICVRH
ncbi:MAG: trypsin-like peptidase domain-containing protein [Pseudolabrys sp.]